jgi:hypothetical protein
VVVHTSLPGQKWREGDDEGLPATTDDIDEDEEYLEQAERFEAQYNFRFEVCCLYVSPGRRILHSTTQTKALFELSR